MRIVVEISEKDYKRIIKNDEDEQVQESCLCLLCRLMQAIKDGAPLPKGHGRIGDLDAVMGDISASVDAMTNVGVVVDGEYLWLKLNDAIDNAPTIIEADKKSEE